MTQARALRLAFAGTPDFAATILRSLIARDTPPVAAYTQPDRATGRGRRQQPSPVKQLAADAGIPIAQPRSLKPSAEHDALRALDLDVLVVAAYGLILPKAVLDLPRFGCINVHASLLPRWRGAAPIERAIMAGDHETGVCIMQMDEGLDTGPVLHRVSTPITPETTGPALTEHLAALGSDALQYCLDRLGALEPAPQSNDGATYAPKLEPVDSHIDWSASAATIANQVRALCGRAPAFTVLQASDPLLRMQVLEAHPADGYPGVDPGTLIHGSRNRLIVACGEGALAITVLKLNRGKGRPMDAAAALNGYTELFSHGTRFLSP